HLHVCTVRPVLRIGLVARNRYVKRFFHSGDRRQNTLSINGQRRSGNGRLDVPLKFLRLPLKLLTPGNQLCTIFSLTETLPSPPEIPKPARCLGAVREIRLHITRRIWIQRCIRFAPPGNHPVSSIGGRKRLCLLAEK